MSTDTPESSAAARSERVLMLAFTFFRLGGLAQVAVAVALAADRYLSVGPVLGLTGVVFAETALLLGVSVRRGRLVPAWMAADVLFCSASLWVGALLVAAQDGHSWAHFMYPLTLLSSIGIGMAFRNVSAMLTLIGILALNYAASAVLVHHDPVWNATPNTVSYLVNTAVAWVVAKELRRGSRALDHSRADAVSRADELARERERARHARLLHDRVLQTLETMSHVDGALDTDLRRHIAAEATWLRALIEGTSTDSHDLLATLQAVVRHKTLTGLRVLFNNSQLHRKAPLLRHLPPETTEAVAGAVHEALTNVAKHSGVDTATINGVLTDDTLTITVLDHGCGFDPTTSPPGTGLIQSIHARMAAVGGQARVESTPGEGTYVEITMPRPPLEPRKTSCSTDA